MDTESKSAAVTRRACIKSQATSTDCMFKFHWSSNEHTPVAELIWFITFAEQCSPTPLVLIIIQTWLKYNQFLAIRVRGVILGDYSRSKCYTLIFMISMIPLLMRQIKTNTVSVSRGQIISWWITAPVSERVRATRWKWRRTGSRCASPVRTSVRKVNHGTV